MAIDTSAVNVTSRESVYSVLTQGDASVSTGLVGFFEWGPCFSIQQVIDEETLISNFGNPTDDNYEHWFTAFSYLAYSNNLQLVRAINSITAKNAGIIAVDADAVDSTPVEIINPTVFNLEEDEPVISFGSNQKMAIYAKYPGDFGNKISVAIANYADFSSAEITTGVTFANQFDYAPKEDEFAIAVYLEDKLVEKFICSVNIDATDDRGDVSYFESLLNTSSEYISAVDNTDITGTNLATFELTALAGGIADEPEESDIILGYDEFENENVDVNIVLDGANTSTTIQQNIIDNIANVRQDVVAYLGPQKGDVVGVPQISTIVSNLTVYVEDTLSRSSSYAAFFGNWKFIFDHINNKNRWVPITGDMAGIYARTVVDREPWYSGFGPTLGKISNIKRLAFSPKHSYRGTLYKARVNPIYNDKEDGPILFGQKTLLSANTVFNRLDNRFLFIYLRDAIDKTARQWIGEKNTAFQRRRFINSITPFLEDVQGREGIGGGDTGEVAFYVKCDTSNNPAQIREQNAFVANILVKPAYSIEFVDLTYSSVSGDVTFEEAIVQNVSTDTP